MNFEDKVYSYFEQALNSLKSGGILSNWEMKRNFQVSECAEIDILVRNNNTSLIAVEIKESLQDSNKAKKQLMHAIDGLVVPFVMIFSSKEIHYLCNKSHLGGKWTKVDIIDLGKIVSHLSGILSELLSGFIEKSPKEEIQRKEVEDKWLSLLQECEFDTKEKIKEFIQKGDWSIESDDLNFTLSENFEDEFFKILITEYKKDALCRFTSMSSLFRTINEKRQSMCCIVCMNDKSEINYVSNRYASFKNHLKNDDYNRYYILSCCDVDRTDDLTMLRLYADDAKGVCIEYSIDNEKGSYSSDFYLGCVSYSNMQDYNPKLFLLDQLLTTPVGGKYLKLNHLNIWQHFFKPYEFRDEQEVRLLLFDNPNTTRQNDFEKKWILNNEYGIVSPIVVFDLGKFPLIIKGITLGPKNHEAEINVKQIQYLINEQRIKVIKNKNKILVKESKIDCYR